jgi:hypothetical protein
LPAFWLSPGRYEATHHSKLGHLQKLHTHIDAVRF